VGGTAALTRGEGRELVDLLRGKRAKAREEMSLLVVPKPSPAWVGEQGEGTGVAGINEAWYRSLPSPGTQGAFCESEHHEALAIMCTHIGRTPLAVGPWLLHHRSGASGPQAPS